MCVRVCVRACAGACVCERLLSHAIAILVPMVLITGHTHESLDRFLALLLAALAGHVALPEMWRAVLAALRTCLAMS